MGRVEISSVTIVNAPDFPEPVEQFRQAVEGGWSATAESLYIRYPGLRPMFDEVLLHSDLTDGLGLEERGRYLEEQHQRLRTIYEERKSAGGPNNNTRWAKNK